MRQTESGTEAKSSREEISRPLLSDEPHDRRRWEEWRKRTEDFSDASADVLLATLRCLAQDARPESVKALNRTARFPVPENAPNRALVRDMALLFRDDPKPIIPLERPASIVTADAARSATLTTEAEQPASLHHRV